jgi:hypothetical protein
MTAPQQKRSGLIAAMFFIVVALKTFSMVAALILGDLPGALLDGVTAAMFLIVAVIFARKARR